jgi:thiol-disulfide isomerase/thioredoxin
MRTYCAIAVLFFIVVSCDHNDDRNSESVIEIEVQKRNNRKPFRTSLLPFSHVDTDTVSFKGLPTEADSFSIQYLEFPSNEKPQDSKEVSEINKDEYSNLNSKVYAYSGYVGNKQIVIVDHNSNLDFSDDNQMVFDKGLKEKLKEESTHRDSIPLIQIHRSMYENGSIAQTTSLLTVFPYENYFTYPNDSDAYKFKNKHQLIAEEKEYFYGEFTIENKAYKVAYKHGLFDTTILFQEKETPFLNRNDPDYQKFTVHDVVKLHGKYYFIDSISTNNTKLILKEAEIKGMVQGHLKDHYIKDFSFSDIVTDKKTSIQKLCDEKEFLLIDFWGTWCAPCMKLTPKLVNMSKEYSSNLNILSFAFQKDQDALTNYIDKHSMNHWNNAFIEGDPKGTKDKPSLIEDLRIESYPTFILIDKNMRIVHRGAGEYALNEIEKMIQSH